MLNKIGAICLILSCLCLGFIITMQFLEAKELSLALLPFLG
jgi:hypothetical protein